MKPLKLVMNAFGTFLHKTEIDFTVLNQQGLYLITGPTGSGKTTIFDAIVYALYGVASGDNRDQDMVRSDFATKKDKTYVSLTFSLEGKVYNIERTPSYIVEGNKTETKKTVVLTMPNGEVIDGITPVKAKIEELLGLDSKQFKQIIMLAQGEFMKFIYSDSKVKDEIFRKLFRTDALKNLENKLKDSLKIANSELKVKKALVDDGLHPFSEFELFNDASIDYTHIPDLIDQAKGELDSKLGELKDKEALEKSNDSKLIDVEKEVTKI